MDGIGGSSGLQLDTKAKRRGESDMAQSHLREWRMESEACFFQPRVDTRVEGQRSGCIWGDFRHLRTEVEKNFDNSFKAEPGRTD